MQIFTTRSDKAMAAQNDIHACVIYAPKKSRANPYYHVHIFTYSSMTQTCAVVKSVCWKTETLSMHWLQMDIIGSSGRAVSQWRIKWFAWRWDIHNHNRINCRNIYIIQTLSTKLQALYKLTGLGFQLGKVLKPEPLRIAVTCFVYRLDAQPTASVCWRKI